MQLSTFLIITVSISLSLSFQIKHDSNLVFSEFGNETQCMPKCLECVKGPNSCTKCTSGFDCCNWACQKCSNQTQCQSCKQRFNLDTNQNICIFQYPCFTGLCLECDDQKNICSRCVVGYYLNVQMQTCEPCPLNCIECLNGYECTKCQESTFRQDGGCKPCNENCLSCHNATICESCQPGYFKTQNGKCQKCLQQCNKCTSSKDCLECNSGHYFDPNIKDCIPCNRPCLQCKGQSQCTSCVDNFYFNKTTGKCLDCNQVYPHCAYCKIDEVQSLGQSLLVYHLEKNKTKETDVVCVHCESKYYLDNSHQCKLCPEHCDECKNYSFCVECSETYFVDDQSLCQQCPIFRCFRCLNKSVCSICSQGTYWNPAISVYQCTKCSIGCLNCDQFGCSNCQVGYYVKNGNCYKCDSSCFRCIENPFSCQTCLTGYFKTTIAVGHCYKCPQPCVECANSTFCTRCMPQHYLQKNACKKCSFQGCDQCKVSESSLNMTLTNDLSAAIEKTPKCIRCSFGYYLKGEQCIKCFEGCQLCSDAQSCLRCDDGFFLNNNGTKCVVCSQHCLHCNKIKQPLQICTKCEEGYSIDVSNSKCLPCMQNCLECFQDYCFNCKEGYYQNKSQQESQGCLQCKSPCKDCQDQAKCLSCVIGYYLNPEDSCIKCQDGCQQCSEDGCFLCESTYRLNYENLTCSKCKVEKCSKCQSSQSVCDICEDGYKNYVLNSIQTSSSMCFRCDQQIQGCRKCNSPTLCVECFSGLTLVNSEDGVSSFCDKEQQKSPWGLLIAIGCLAVMVFVLTGVICIQRRRAKKDENQGQGNARESLIDENSYSINSEEVISDKHLRRPLG